MQKFNFENIRPYNNHEVNEKIQILLADPVFDRVLINIYNDPETVKKVKEQLSGIQTIEQLQSLFIVKLLENVVTNTSQGLTFDGLENLDKDKSYLFISNHRDIILDSALLNLLILNNGMNTTQIAIGSNLLILDWIVHAVKLNRSFVINRSAAVRELLTSAQTVSQYIRQIISEKNISVWIAQREGRTKDGFDQTQPSLLKMLNMSNSKKFSDGFSELNIVPVSISYEIEPCSVEKIKELIKKDQKKGYVKRSKDDLKSMARGMFGQKGRIHFSFGKPLNSELENFNNSKKPNVLIQQLVDNIDDHIHKQFKLWPNNYIAHDLLMNNQDFKDKYSKKEFSEFLKLLGKVQSEINEDPDEIKERFINLYANPVINAKS